MNTWVRFAFQLTCENCAYILFARHGPGACTRDAGQNTYEVQAGDKGALLRLGRKHLVLHARIAFDRDRSSDRSRPESCGEQEPPTFA